MRFGRTLIALALAVVLVAGCGADPALNHTGAAPKASQGGVDLSAATFQDQTSDASVEVDAIDNLFRPKYIKVKAGTKITFRNDGRNRHNVLPVDERDFAEITTVKFEPGTEVAITLDKPGDVPYYCSLHGTTTKGMIGAIRVVP